MGAWGSACSRRGYEVRASESRQPDTLEEHSMLTSDSRVREQASSETNAMRKQPCRKERSPLSAYAKVLALTVVTSYPFIGMISRLSSIEGKTFSPCNEASCIFIRVFPASTTPSTIDMTTWKNPFKIVRNGMADAKNRLPDLFLPSVCPNMTSNDMQNLCASAGLPNIRIKGVNMTAPVIHNHLRNAVSLYVYVFAMVGWNLAKIVHDCLLLADYPEFVTLNVGLMSAVFQCIMVAAVFLWCMGAISTFWAPVIQHSCACYYQLPTLDTLLALVTPAILYVMLSNKSVCITRAPLSGDYLYFMQYDVPFKLLAYSGGDVTKSYLVGRTVGAQALPNMEHFSLSQLRSLCLFTKFVDYFMFKGLVPISLAVTSGPLTQRLLQWLIDHIDVTNNGFLPCACVFTLIAGIVWIAGVAVVDLMGRYVDFQRMEVKSRVKEASIRTNVKRMIRFLLPTCTTLISAGVLVRVLTWHLLGHHADKSADTGLCWAASGVGFAFAILLLEKSRRRPYSFMLSIAARHPKLSPADYIDFASQSEFDLEAEKQIAQDFQSSLKPHGDRELEWHAALGWQDSRQRCCCYSSD